MPENRTPSRVVGILGGMGPAATVDFYDKLVRASPAATDQEHLRVVIWADPTIPNRHAALLGNGEDPRPSLERGVDTLIGAGAEILVVPCNTVHAFLDDVTAGKNIEFISIIETTIDAVTAQRSLAEVGFAVKVGIVAADGTIVSGMYQRALVAAGMEPVLVSDASQEGLMQVIYRIKAGTAGPDDSRQVAALFDELQSAGASVVIAGCTEISILLEHLDVPVPVIDPSQVLALRTIERARTG